MPSDNRFGDAAFGDGLFGDHPAGNLDLPPAGRGRDGKPPRRSPLRLGPLAVRGEIDNTRPYNVCGWVKLRGQEHPITLNLTGDAGEGLKGKRVRFEALADRGVETFTPPELSDALAWQQVGPTGPMTLAPARRPLSSGAPVGEALRLEWDSQNGRVLLDLPAAAVTVLPSLDEEDELAMLDDDPDEEFAGPDFDDEEDDDDGNVGLFIGGGGGGALFDDEDDDPFGLFDPDLQDALDDEADDLDRQVLPDYEEEDDDPPGGQFASDLRRLEALIEGGAGVPIGQVFDPPLRLRRPDALDDVRVETALKLLLSRLAEHGIALDVCEHFTPRDCYAYLLEEICPAELTHPELDPVRWVQHFTTSDACPECEAEFDREFEEYERNRGRDDDKD